MKDLGWRDMAAVVLLVSASTSAMAAPGNQSLAGTIAAMPKGIGRAEGPSLAVAVPAAELAVKMCAAKHAKVSVLVADAAGEPVVILSGDGAGVRSRLIAESKVATVMKFKRASGDVADEAAHNPELAAEAASDPQIGMLRGGGFPVLRDGRMIGAVGVSGATIYGALGMDEACSKAAVAFIEAHP